VHPSDYESLALNNRRFGIIAKSLGGEECRQFGSTENLEVLICARQSLLGPRSLRWCPGRG